MKNLKKIIPVLMVVIMLLSIFSTVMAATDPSTLTGTDTTAFNSLGNTIIGMVRAIGTIIAVIMLIVIGIKYMMGSAEEKAEYKKTLLPYIIGAVLIFAASQLAGLIYTWTNTNIGANIAG